MVSIETLVPAYVSRRRALAEARPPLPWVQAPARRAAVRWHGLVVGALLALYAVMAWTASLSKGQSFDEGLQLAVGYNLWVNDDSRIEGANGDFIKRWATLPYLISRPQFVPSDDFYYQRGLPYELAYRFFFELGNRPESLLQQGRAMVALLGMAAAWLVYRCSRELFGRVGGLVSLTLFVFSPHMLAFGGIVSTDMSITLLLFASTWCVWRLLHEITAGRVLASLGCFSLLVLAKPTALVILPITAVLVAVKLIGARRLVLRWREATRVIATRRNQAAVFAGLTLVHALAGWSAIWAHYGFRYSASPPGASGLSFYQPVGGDDVALPLMQLLAWTERTQALPEGFHRGLQSLVANDDELGAFMNGSWSIGGRPLFFPYAIWVKTQPALFVLLGCAVIAIGLVRQARAHDAARGRWYDLAPFLTLIACYFAFAVAEDLNIGHRHILPIYPALYVLAGAATLMWARRRALGASVIVAALAWEVSDSFAARPHYLAYFGPQAGGSESGYRRLVDSSLDWGMNLPDLRRWLDAHDPARREPLFLAYFGTDSPKYHGIAARRLPGFFDRREVEAYTLTPGYYAISATLLQSVYTSTFGPWSRAYEERYQLALARVRAYEEISANQARYAGELGALSPAERKNELDIHDQLRFGRLCAWLRHHGDPPHHVGHSILIWKLSAADLESALHGPPVELTDDPLPERQYGRYQVLGD